MVLCGTSPVWQSILTHTQRLPPPLVVKGQRVCAAVIHFSSLDRASLSVGRACWLLRQPPCEAAEEGSYISTQGRNTPHRCLVWAIYALNRGYYVVTL